MEKRLVEQQQSFCQFRHEHPLKSTDSAPKDTSFCSACRLKIPIGNNKHYYTCKTCPFFLHNVCHNMPKRTQHPSHPAHHLTLKNSPLKQPSKCEACQGTITTKAHYYSCDQCGLWYHILCLALPLSIQVSHHTHQLRLAFSPPYSFRCDICAIPGFGGWLYRCQICEFDSHLMCTVSNRKALSNNIAHSSSRSCHGAIGAVSVDYCSEVDGIIQLAIENLKCQGTAQEPVPGSDFRLQSPVENQKQSDKHSVHVSVSEETSTVTSFQFSDALFSLDLAKSYSGYDPTKQTICKNERSKVEGSKSDCYRDPHESKNSELKKEIGTAHNYSFHIGRDGRLKEAFLNRNDTLSRQELGHKAQTTLPHKDRSSGSSWQKLICFCFTS